MMPRRRLGRQDPVRSEQVPVQVQLIFGHVVDLGDHPGPVELDQGADQWAEPQQLIARAGQQIDGGPRGPWRRSRAGENDSRGPQRWYKNGNTAWADPTA
jgi:hypothetical protein